MNIYSKQFVSFCPNNNVPIVYLLQIKSLDMIYVEHINTACDILVKAFHEKIADTLFSRFGGQQTLTAHHHGVDIETRRGFE